MNPLHATIEEFAADGYTHIECFCPRCRVIRLRPMSWLPRISMGLTLDALARRLRCAECGGPLQSVKPWRQADVLGKPEGRRGYRASCCVVAQWSQCFNRSRPIMGYSKGLGDAR